MQNNLKAAILAALLLAPAVSFAQEAEESESNFSGNAGIVTDYVFRGVSQTNGDIAMQGGLDYAFGDSGFYVGAWGSNVDFDEFQGPEFEIDAYVGYAADLGEKFNIDLMLTRYNYIGTGDDYGSIDYNEVIAKFAMTNIATLTVGYTDDYVNSGEDATYVSLGNSWDLGNDYSLNASFGRSYFTDGDFNDWNLGISKTIGPVEIGLNYYDTNLEGPRVSDAVVFSFKLGG